MHKCIFQIVFFILNILFYYKIQIINFLCASVAWYTAQYGRYEETPIEELLTFYGLKLTETISEKDSGEFSKILERRIREYLSKW